MTGEAAVIEHLPAAQFRGARHRTLIQPLVEKLLPGVDLASAALSLLDCGLAAATTGEETVIEITFLGLVGPAATEPRSIAATAPSRQRDVLRWQSLYMKLPWEDWRHGRPSLIDAVIMPHLVRAASGSRAGRRRGSAQRHRALVEKLFPRGEAGWDTTRAFERFDLLAATGILPDAVVAGAGAESLEADTRLGTVMASGDRRRLALALGRLRSAVKDRPNVKPLMPAEFTLFELQKCVEAVLGPALHKQNFRRQLEAQGLLEPLGRLKSNTGGRPAQLYRFAG